MENELATQGKPVSALAKFNNLLSQENIKKKFEETLGKKAPMFISNLTTIMSGSAELQKCEHMSIISSALMAASMDLPLTPGLGFAGIVPYWDSTSGSMKAQFQVMKKGYIQLAQRTGQFRIINVSEVYEGEIKSHNKFTGEYVFDENSKKSDKIVGYVSYFKLVNGFEKYYYMPIEKLDAHARKYSKSFQKGKGKWADKEEGGYEQMCEKTVLKLNLSTYAPLSVDVNMMNAVIYDQAEIRDMEAKDFNYMDNEESKQIENKEVLELGQEKTMTITENAGKRAESISQSVSQMVDKSKGDSPKIEDAQIVKEEPQPNEEVFEWWNVDYLTNMKDKIYDFAKIKLPEAKLKILESLPGRKSNKLYRDCLIAFHEERLDKWLMKQLSQNSDHEDADQVGSTAKNEKVPENNSGELRIGSEEAVNSFNSQKQEGELLFPSGEIDDRIGDFVIPSIDPDTKLRAFKDVIELHKFLSSKGVSGSMVDGGNLETFCKKATFKEVKNIVEAAKQYYKK